MANIYITVENAGAGLNNLKSLNRPLTAEEKLAGRKAALFIGQDIKDKIKASQEEEVKYLMERGYTAQEAREKIRLEDFARAESVGLGVSKKCRFRKRKAC